MGSPLNQGLTGKQVGANLVQTGGEFGERLMTELNPRYYEWAYRGNVFNACPQSSLTWTAGLTTATGLVFGIQNPPTSGKNLALINAGFSLTQTTAAVIGISVAGFTSVLNTATTTGPTIQSAFTPGPQTSVARVVSVAASPIVQMILGGIGTSAITAATDFVEIGGAIIIGQGCTAAIMASAAQTGWASLAWVELPI